MSVTPHLMKGVANNKSKSSCTTAIGTSNKNGSMASKSTFAARASPTRHRHKVRDFNSLITCSLCHGYLVNATTIDNCLHSYCRSCIIKHLKKDKHCPQCRPSSKMINFMNLRPDRRLKSLVYKLVPGLYQREQERYLDFILENQAAKEKESFGNIATPDEDDDFFSPVEPISLSLEYHPKSLMSWHKQQIPSIRYLQCPAAVTVQHLKRFIASKFDIDMDNERVDIEIIYENEVLPANFSLMDVGYCYLWKRTAPMRFFYRILIHNLCNTNTSQVDLCDKALNEENCQYEAKRKEKSKETDLRKSVRFKESDNNDSSTDKKGNDAMEEAENTTGVAETDSCDDFFRRDGTKFESTAHREAGMRPNKTSEGLVSENKNEKDTYNDNNNYKLNNNYMKDPQCKSSDASSKGGHIYGDDRTHKSKHNNNYCNQKHVTIPNNNNNNDSYSNHISNANDADGKSDKSDPNAKKKRTNDVSIEINDTNSSLRIGKKEQRDLEKATHERNGSKAEQKKNTETKLSPKTKESSQKSHTPKPVTTPGADGKKSKVDEIVPAKKTLPEALSPEDTMKKCDIFVSIPPMSQPLSVASENGLDNLPLSQLKTANKKNSKNSQNYDSYQKHSGKEKKKGSSPSYDGPKPDLPKLKIELSGMKSKFMIAKRPTDDKSSSKSSSKSPKHKSSYSSSNFTTETFKVSRSSQEGAIATNTPIAHVDLTTYAKNIGLKPINQDKQERTQTQHSSRESKERGVESKKTTTDLSTSSIPTCVIDDSTEGSEMQCQILSSHKKRKKDKHSKEPKEVGSNKRRRIHAEISSQHIDKSLKLKVKITANHKSHKTEKKTSTEKDSKESTPTTPPVTIPISLPTASLSTTVKPSSTSSSTTPKPISTPTEAGADVSISETPTKANLIAPLERPGPKDSITSKVNESPGCSTSVAVANKTPPILSKVETEKEAPKTASPSNDKPPEKRALPRMPRIKHTLLMPNPTRISSEDQSKQYSHLIKQCANNRMKPSSMISISEVYPAPRLETITTSPNKSINYTLITSSNPIITPAIDSANPACVVTPGISLTQLPQSQRVRFLHDAKISPSPPLPPSLFKTAPMHMQPLMHCPVRTTPVQVNKTKPSAQIEPRVAFQGDLLQSGKVSSGRFPVLSHPPILPKPIQQNNTHAAGIISTNSNSHSILKRPAPDTSATVAKQRKIDQDRAMKKPVASSSVSVSKVRASGTLISNVFDKPVNSQPIPNSYAHFTSNPLSPTYAPVSQDRKQTTVVIPTCSVSVTKMTDGSAESTRNTDNRAELNKRPAFEIVRIHSNIPPVDKQKLTVTTNNTIKQSHLKTVRPPPPPIPLVKIKRPSPQSANITNNTGKIEEQSGNSPPILSNKKESPPPLNNTQKPKNELTVETAKDVESPEVKQNSEGSPSTNNLASSPTDSKTAGAKKVEGSNEDTTSPVCDKIGALDLSGKSSRSPSVEKTVLLNTPPTTPTVLTAEDQTSTNIKTALQAAKAEFNASLISKLGLYAEKSAKAERQASSPPQEPLKSPVPAVEEKSNVATKPTPPVKTQPVSTATELKKESAATTPSTRKTPSPKTPQMPTESSNSKPKVSPKPPSGEITKADVSQDSKRRESLEGRSDSSVKNSAVMNNETLTFPTPSSYTSLYSSSNLQNLKMLSESAITREKLSVKNLRQVPMLSKLNDKMRQNSTVRQQNASVRNIPNPSALALRNCPSMPMLAALSKSSPVNPAKPVEKTSEPNLSTTSNDISTNKKNGASEPGDSRQSNESTTKTPAQNQQYIPKIDLTVASPCGSPVPFSAPEQEKKQTPQPTTPSNPAVHIDLCKSDQSNEAGTSKKQPSPSNEISGDPSPSCKEKVTVSSTSDNTVETTPIPTQNSNSIKADSKTTTAVPLTSPKTPSGGDVKKVDVACPPTTSSAPTVTSEKTIDSSTPKVS